MPRARSSITSLPSITSIYKCQRNLTYCRKLYSLAVQSYKKYDDILKYDTIRNNNLYPYVIPYNIEHLTIQSPYLRNNILYLQYLHLNFFTLLYSKLSHFVVFSLKFSICNVISISVLPSCIPSINREQRVEKKTENRQI